VQRSWRVAKPPKRVQVARWTRMVAGGGRKELKCLFGR
jgi:hypothetical protein